MTILCARDQFVHLRNLVEVPAHWRAVHAEGITPAETIAAFAANLRQLIGVPFKYLVPTNAMLPPESIRFFFVDQNWVDALVDGALSLGRIGNVDLVHDQALAPVLIERAENLALNQRRLQLHQPATREALETPVYGGFLLRSALVSGWPGLEVQAYKAAEGSGVNTRCSGEKVELVRMERLASDVLICLFAEQFGCVNIHEPKEGINFGAAPQLPAGAAVDQADPESYKKQLRGLGINNYPLAEPIQGAVVQVPLRSPTSRVVQVDALRLAMVDRLKALQPPAFTGTQADFTSAQFSLQMIEGASQHVFRADNTVAPVALAASNTTRRCRKELRADDEKALNAFLFGAEENA